MPYFNRNEFEKFDLNTNSWVSLPDFPYPSDWGSDLIDGGNGYLYATFGARRDFYRYSEAVGWQRMASMPQTIYYGGAVARIGTTIYVQVGNSSSYFLKYDIASDSWSYANDTPNGSLNHGATLIGDNSRYLYSVTGTELTQVVGTFSATTVKPILGVGWPICPQQLT